MKRLYSLVILAGMAITFVVLSALAQEANAPDPKVREQFVALAKKFDDAWNKNDAAAMSALYADDAVIVDDTGPIQGRDAIAKHFADLFQNVHFSDHVVTVDAYSPHMIGTGNEIWWNGKCSAGPYLEVPTGNLERNAKTVTRCLTGYVCSY